MFCPVSTCCHNRKTMDDALSPQCLEYIGACSNEPESLELLTFHGNLLLYHLGSLQGMETYHRSFPWRAVQALDPTSWPDVLSHMQRIWQFTVEFVDTLKVTDALHWELQMTRYQSFRDLMICGEYLVTCLYFLSTTMPLSHFNLYCTYFT